MTSRSAKHLNASSSFLLPPCSPPPRLLPVLRVSLRPPLLPPAALPPSSSGPHARTRFPLAARLPSTVPLLSPRLPPYLPHLFFHITDPFFLDTPQPPLCAAVVHPAQESGGRKGKSRIKEVGGRLSRGHRGGLGTLKSRFRSAVGLVPAPGLERALTRARRLPEGEWSSPGRRLQAGGADPMSPAPRLRSRSRSALNLAGWRRGLVARRGRKGVGLGPAFGA